IATVMIDAIPDARTPKALTAVKNTTLVIATGTTKPGPAKTGLIHDRAEAPAIATAAWAAQLETQKDQATRKAGMRPNCRSMLAWIPSPPSRERRASENARVR